MKEDPELEIGEEWSEDNSYKLKRRHSEFGGNRFIRILLVSLLVLAFVGGILYFLGRQPREDETILWQPRMTVLEQKTAALEKQVSELQGKGTSGNPDPALLQRLEALALRVEELEKHRPLKAESKAKVEVLEKQKPARAEPKARVPVPPKPAVSAEKQYHTVQKGETLYGISKKYGMSVEDLRKLNNLAVGQSVRSGQKLLVSSER